MARSRRVAVTGLGAVCAAGWGVEPFRRALRSGKTAIGAFDRFDHSRQRTHVAGQVPAAPPSCDAFIHWNRLSNSDRFALFAASEAVGGAGLSRPFHEIDAGVFFGSSTGGLLEAEEFFEALCSDAGTARRTLLASHGISAPAEAVARYLGVAGPVETISSACASGGLAIEQAFRAVRDGELEVAITGGADCLCRTTYSGFNALRAVDEQPCRPFRSGRAGMSLGEGGAVLVLETMERAVARGARVLAEVLGAGSSCDAHHMTAPKSEGEGAALAIARALQDAAAGPETIDFINAHATGTPLNDSAEYAAVRRIFGERSVRIPIEATKSTVGHLLGAAGAIEAVAAVLTLIDEEVHPVAGEGAIDESTPLDLVVRAARRAPGVRTGLSTNFGFGGANAAVVFGRCDADAPL